MLNTGQVRAALRAYYPSNEYAVMWEVGNATGGNTKRWADAVVVSLWPSRGLHITGIEIKVSRSDWTRELKNPAKAEEIAQYCDYWSVVTPEAIVHEHELPLTWGHLVVNDKGLIRQRVKPTKNDTPAALSRGFVAAMLRRAGQADEAEVQALVGKQTAAIHASAESRITRQVEQATKRYESISAKVEELRALGLDLNGWEGAAEIVSQYKMGRDFKEATQMIKHSQLPSQLEKLSALFSKVRDDVGSINMSRKD